MSPYQAVVHKVPLIPQTASNSCWAASIAMIKSWQAGSVVSEATVVKASGNGASAAMQTGLGANDRGALNANGLVVDNPRVYSADAIKTLLRDKGPLWFASMKIDSPEPHIRVVTGIEGSEVLINDPWPIGRGDVYRRSFAIFHERIEVLKQLDQLDSQPNPVYVAHLR